MVSVLVTSSCVFGGDEEDIELGGGTIWKVSNG